MSSLTSKSGASSIWCYLSSRLIVGSLLPTFRDYISFMSSKVRESSLFSWGKGTEPLHKRLCNVFRLLGKNYFGTLCFKFTSPWSLLRWLPCRQKPSLCIRHYLPLYQFLRCHNEEDHKFSTDNFAGFESPVRPIWNLIFGKKQNAEKIWKKIYIFLISF